MRREGRESSRVAVNKAASLVPDTILEERSFAPRV